MVVVRVRAWMVARVRAMAWIIAGAMELGLGLAQFKMNTTVLMMSSCMMSYMMMTSPCTVSL